MYIETFDIDGKHYEIEYMLDDEDILTCYLPDGSTRSTSLQGNLSIRPTIRVHLKAALNMQTRKTPSIGS